VRTREDVLKEMLAACRIQTAMLDDLHFAMADHIATLTRERDALTMHMNQVHATLGGTDTVLTLEAAQHVVFERDEARERLAQWVSWGDRMASGHPDAPMASLDHEVRAVIANRYGMSVITRNTPEDA
jgi:hypothetical protein